MTSHEYLRGPVPRPESGFGPAGHIQHPGPFLDDFGWQDGMVPANEPGWREAAADAKRRLHAPTEAEKLEAHGVIAQRRAAGEAQRPSWWGKDHS